MHLELYVHYSNTSIKKYHCHFWVKLLYIVFSHCLLPQTMKHYCHSLASMVLHRIEWLSSKCLTSTIWRTHRHLAKYSRNCWILIMDANICKLQFDISYFNELQNLVICYIQSLVVSQELWSLLLGIFNVNGKLSCKIYIICSEFWN